jgi:hypothetical protein
LICVFKCKSFKTFFLVKQIFFPFFSFNLGHFIAISLFSYVKSEKAQKQKLENGEKLSLVGLTPGLLFPLQVPVFQKSVILIE